MTLHIYIREAFYADLHPREHILIGIHVPRRKTGFLMCNISIKSIKEKKILSKHENQMGGLASEDSHIINEIDHIYLPWQTADCIVTSLRLSHVTTRVTTRCWTK